MAALHLGTAFSEKGSGVPDGVARSRVAHDEASLAASAGARTGRKRA